MASFTAELQVAGQRYPVRHCYHEFTQATSERGRVSAKVRHGFVRLTLDVPENDVLLGWAATPHKPLGGRVVFFDGKGGPVLETLAWEAGECVGYQEEFVAGSVSAGAYVCHLTIAAPQLTMLPGGPVAYVSPAARDHGELRWSRQGGQKKDVYFFCIWQLKPAGRRPTSDANTTSRLRPRLCA